MDGEADLDNALSWDQIDAIEYQLPERDRATFALVDDETLQELRNRSLARQESLPEFDYLKQRVNWFEERHERDFVSLNLEQRRQEKEELEARRDAFEDRRNELSRDLAYDVVSVDLAITEEKEAAHQAKLRDTPLPNGQPRSNAFYQKVFYYEEPESGEIHEIWVEYFDYDKALDQAPAFAKVLSKSYGQPVSVDQTREILTRFKNRDLGSEFNVLDPFAAVLGDQLDSQAMLAAMPAFFTKMVEVDPDVLLERAKLDVMLRESLRIVRDWAEINSPLSPTKVALSLQDPRTETDDKETAAKP
jgi:hypothetical protein